MNNIHTLGGMRADVFRVLDEYSRNGENHDIFSGGTGDMENRFVSALNGALCLIDRAVGSEPKRKNVCFSRPGVIFEACSFVLSDGQKSIEVPFLCGSLSFDFTGCGKLAFFDAQNEKIREIELAGDFGNIETAKFFVPQDAVRMVFSTDTGLAVEKLKCYDKSGLLGNTDEKALPDGKKLFCAISPRVSEIVSVFGTKYSGKREYPCDLFEIRGGLACCDEKYAGTYTFEYFEYPESFDESDPPDTEICLSPLCYEAALYAVAAALCEREDGELYTRLTYKYREMLANLYPKNNLKRKNSFFAGGIFGRRRRGYLFRG